MTEEKYHILEPGELVVCPYDSSHMIRQKRLVYHIKKCRKNHIDRDMGICPFNAQHAVPNAKLRHHIANCTDRCRIESDLMYDLRINNKQNKLKGFTDVPIYNNVPLGPSRENWDAESRESGTRYTHNPFMTKVRSEETQKKPNEHKASNNRKTPCEPVTSKTQLDTTELLYKLKMEMNPIYCMGMAGMGRGKGGVNSASSTPQKRTVAQEAAVIIGRGRGITNERPVKRVGRVADI